MSHYPPESFNENGFTAAIDVVSAKEASEILHEVEEYVRGIATNTRGVNDVDHSRESTPWETLKGDSRFKTHLFLPAVNSLVWNKNVIDSVLAALNSLTLPMYCNDKKLTQDDILLWSSDLCVKTPQSEGVFPMHQDSTYAGLDPPLGCVTCWVALSPEVDQAGLLIRTNLLTEENFMWSSPRRLLKFCMSQLTARVFQVVTTNPIMGSQTFA